MLLEQYHVADSLNINPHVQSGEIDITENGLGF